MDIRGSLKSVCFNFSPLLCLDTTDFFAEGYFEKQSNKNLLKRSNVCTEECFGKFEKITANINTKKNEKNPKKCNK